MLCTPAVLNQPVQGATGWGGTRKENRKTDRDSRNSSSRNSSSSSSSNNNNNSRALLLIILLYFGTATRTVAFPALKVVTTRLRHYDERPSSEGARVLFVLQEEEASVRSCVFYIPKLRSGSSAVFYKFKGAKRSLGGEREQHEADWPCHESSGCSSGSGVESAVSEPTGTVENCLGPPGRMRHLYG